MNNFSLQYNIHALDAREFYGRGGARLALHCCGFGRQCTALVNVDFDGNDLLVPSQPLPGKFENVRQVHVEGGCCENSITLVECGHLSV